jgi:hypothetical protein
VLALRRADQNLPVSLDTVLEDHDELAVLVAIGRLERLRAGELPLFEPILTALPSDYASKGLAI